MPKFDDSEIENFCSCCDKYCEIDRACGVLLYEQQKKCVEDDFCEWGFVNGESVFIRSKYIIQYGKNKSRQIPKTFL